MIDTIEKKKITIADIAAQAGVASCTVSMVLRNQPGFSQATREHVMEVAKKMKYTMFPMRQTRGRVHWGQIAFIIVSRQTPPPNKKFPMHYLNHMMSGCAACVEEKGSSMVFSHMHWQQVEEGNLSAVMERERVDGFLFRAWISPAVEKMLRNISVPVVLVDCDRYLDKYPSVHVDNLKGMDLVVEHLVKQGAKRFATITGDMNHQNARERLAGLQIALTRRGITLPPEGIITECDFVYECGRRGAKKLLESGYRFDALVCHFDLSAYGAIEALTSAGIKVPDDVRVTGFDNEEFSNWVAPTLTTVETNSDQVGRLGVQLLMAQIGEENKQNLRAVADVSLVVRTSA